MNTQEQIEAFNQANPPFYIVDHEDGSFSLCLPLDFLTNEYRDYCQEAFDAYAVEIGEPPVDQHGSIAYGNGYDWEAAFQEAFKDDPNIGKIVFDCELGGFVCYADDLSLIEDFGKRFKEICEDTGRFVPIIAEGIRRKEERQAEKEKLEGTVRGRLLQRPGCTFEILTPDGGIRLTPEDTKKLLGGEMQFVEIEGTTYSAEELLGQCVESTQTDLFNPSLVRLKTEEPGQDFLASFFR